MRDAGFNRKRRLRVLDADARDVVLSNIARSSDVHVRDRIRAIAELNKCAGRHLIRNLQPVRITLAQALEMSRRL